MESHAGRYAKHLKK